MDQHYQIQIDQFQQQYQQQQTQIDFDFLQNQPIYLDSYENTQIFSKNQYDNQAQSEISQQKVFLPSTFGSDSVQQTHDELDSDKNMSNQQTQYYLSEQSSDCELSNSSEVASNIQEPFSETSSHEKTFQDGVYDKYESSPQICLEQSQVEIEEPNKKYQQNQQFKGMYQRFCSLFNLTLPKGSKKFQEQFVNEVANAIFDNSSSNNKDIQKLAKKYKSLDGSNFINYLIGKLDLCKNRSHKLQGDIFNNPNAKKAAANIYKRTTIRLDELIEKHYMN